MSHIHLPHVITLQAITESILYIKMSTNQKEKGWKGIKITPIKEDEDGTNNFNGFKQKLKL